MAIPNLTFLCFFMLMIFCDSNKRSWAVEQTFGMESGEAQYTHIFIGEIFPSEYQQKNQGAYLRDVLNENWFKKVSRLTNLRFMVSEKIIGKMDSDLLFSPIGCLYADGFYWNSSNSPVFLELNKRYLVKIMMADKDITLKNIRDTCWVAINIEAVDESEEDAGLRAGISAERLRSQQKDFSRLGGGLHFSTAESYAGFRDKMSLAVTKRNSKLNEVIADLGRPLFRWQENEQSVIVYACAWGKMDEKALSVPRRALIYLLFNDSILAEYIIRENPRVIPNPIRK